MFIVRSKYKHKDWGRNKQCSRGRLANVSGLLLTFQRQWFEMTSTHQEGDVYETAYDITKTLRRILVNYEDAGKF